MKGISRGKLALVCVAGVALALALALGWRAVANRSVRWEWAGRPALIRPDYAGIVVPPNIAPLNFEIAEPGCTQYRVRISSGDREPILIRSRVPGIRIPLRPWRRLLAAARGGSLRVDIAARGPDGTWRRFAAMTNTVAEADVDPFLVYRLIRPLYNYSRVTGVYQRNLESFDESPVLRGQYVHKASSGSCVNCHTFLNNRTERMTLGIRDRDYGNTFLLAQGDQVSKVNTKLGYAAWHPSGRLLVFSVNAVRMFFHGAGTEVRDVVDLESSLACYRFDTQKIETDPALTAPDRLATYPAWSPDGRYLYYCSAPILWTDRKTTPPVNYDKVRYDLMRISYDVDRNAWGKPETLLRAEDTGLSILLPRVSPDGRFLVFCMCDYGCFPVYRPSSDLYVMDLENARRTGTFEYRALEINSDQSESWHAWSSNSRWLVFSSKRGDGLFTKPWLSYVDADGRAHKPFVLPQEDPAFYDAWTQTFSVPEFVSEPVRATENQFAAAVRQGAGGQTPLPAAAATPAVPAVPAAMAVPPTGTTGATEQAVGSAAEYERE